MIEASELLRVVDLLYGAALEGDWTLPLRAAATLLGSEQAGLFQYDNQIHRGIDRFVIANGSGIDTIFDFEDDKDVIDLTGYAGIAGFAQIAAQATQVVADVRIDLGLAAGGSANVDVVTLVAFVVADLDAGDFDFA